MNSLYIVTISIGTPRQRVWRGEERYYATGATPQAAGRRACVAWSSAPRESYDAGRSPRFEAAVALCTTLDTVCRLV